MGSVTAFAPAKSILFGEHYVVYGAEGIACGIEPYNEITIQASGREGLLYVSDIGTLSVSGEKSGCPKGLEPALAAYRKACALWPGAKSIGMEAQVASAWKMKGVGNSASLCAALGAGIAAMAGKNATEKDCFEIAQEGDRVAHGGSPSGIDASSVSYGGMLSVRKIFGETARYEFARKKFKHREGWRFFVVDTSREGEIRANTAGQIAKFAKAHGIAEKPEMLPERKRQAVIEEYAHIAKDALGALENGKMQEVAALMDENHSLLRKFDVSCPGAERAISIAKKAGASGAKMTGAGGEGGALLVLCEMEKAGNVRMEMEKSGYAAYDFRPSEKGAHAIKQKQE
jgi:mevalonate kinase